MLFQTTHQIQRRDLLWGCYTKVSTQNNLFWKKKIIIKNQLNIPEFLGWGTAIYSWKALKVSFLRGCVYFGVIVALSKIFIFNPLNNISNIKKQCGFTAVKYTSYKEMGSSLYIQYTITEYNFRSILLIPFIITQELGKEIYLLLTSRLSIIPVLAFFCTCNSLSSR